MKVQDVLLKAIAKKITWWAAAEIIGVTDRTMRRWRERLEEGGYAGLTDRRKGKPSAQRIPLATTKAGEKVDKHRLTQVGRAMKELGIQMIAAYSPQARAGRNGILGRGKGGCRRNSAWRGSPRWKNHYGSAVSQLESVCLPDRPVRNLDWPATAVPPECPTRRFDSPFLVDCAIRNAVSGVFTPATM